MSELPVGADILLSLTPAILGGISLPGYRKEQDSFGQDIHGPFNPSWGSNIGQWKKSMQKLLELKADILCEGHFGIYRPASRVQGYIDLISASIKVRADA